MLECSALGAFGRALADARAKLVLEVTGVSPLPDVRYQVSAVDAYDPAAPATNGEPALLYPNTTTFIDIVLNRRQTDRLLVMKDQRLEPLPGGPAEAGVGPPTGRGALVVARRQMDGRPA
jgi:hypothetical protein